jgi:hypothetical protein
MVGFLKGLFRKRNTEEVEAPEVKAVVQPTRTTGAYFLDVDSAKTYGDIDYMRTAKSVRRTFRDTKTGGEIERISQVSSMEMKRKAELASGQLGSGLNSATNPKTGSSDKTSDVAARRKADSSMDMFRSMARDIKKP